MRSAFHLCGMPLRRPRSSRKPRSSSRSSSTPSASPLPPPLPLAAPPASPEEQQQRLPRSGSSSPPSLARFAEDAVSTDAGLSDVDFSAVMHPDMQYCIHAASEPHPVPTPMVMDAVSRKWIGNEHHFERFNDEVTRVPAPEALHLEDHAPFRVPIDVERGWQNDGRDHNERLAPWGRHATGMDIRELAAEFEQRRRRR